MSRDGERSQLDWLLDDLVARLAGGEQVTVLSADGLMVSRSANLPVEDAEHLCALASGLQSLAMGAARQFRGGGVRQTVIEMDSRLLLVTAAGEGAALALVADGDADLGMIAYELTLMVKQVGTYLRSAPRSAPAGLDTR